MLSNSLQFARWRHKLCGKSRLSWSISAMETSCFGDRPGWGALTLQTKEEPIPLNWWKRNFATESSKPFRLEGSIVPMKVTLERLGPEQPKVSECWNKGEHGNFAISFMRPPGIFQGLSGAMLSFKVRFLKNHHFLQLRDPSILRELHLFPCSLPYTSHYVSTFF